MHGAALLYNLLLAELEDLRDLVDAHREAFGEWRPGSIWPSCAGGPQYAVGHGDRPRHTVIPATRRFVENWIRLAAGSRTGLPDHVEARELVRRREQALKQARSRFTNAQARKQWGGYAALAGSPTAGSTPSGCSTISTQGWARRLMLSPDQRSLYTAAFAPPAGYVFDEALATTYSLDLITLLSIPVHLALVGERAAADPLKDGIALLEALRRYTSRLTVYAQGGQLQVRRRAARSVRAARARGRGGGRAAGGAFHRSSGCSGSRTPRPGAVRLRLLVLSRNLTADNAWDLVLTLEGEPRGRNVAVNRSLSELLAALPDFAIRPWRRRVASRRYGSPTSCAAQSGTAGRVRVGGVSRAGDRTPRLRRPRL